MFLRKANNWTLCDFSKRSEQTNIFISINGKAISLICTKCTGLLKECIFLGITL
jgi:hypothetical protein